MHGHIPRSYLFCGIRYVLHSPEIMFDFYYIMLNVVLLHHCTDSSTIIMHLYISLGFYAFQSVFFDVIYDLWIIHSSYFIYFIWCGKQIDRPPTFTHIVQVVINYLLFYRNIQCFTMAMPFNMILILHVILCKLCDFSKLTILCIHMYIYSIIFMTNKSVMTFLCQ